MLWSEIRKGVLRQPAAEGEKAGASVTQGTTGSGMRQLQEAGKQSWLGKNGFPAVNFNSDLGPLLVELVCSAPQCFCLWTPTSAHTPLFPPLSYLPLSPGFLPIPPG